MNRRWIALILLTALALSCGRGLRRTGIDAGGGGGDGGEDGGTGGSGGGSSGGSFGELTVSPTTGPQRTPLTITGTGFSRDRAVTVTIGGSDCYAAAVTSSTQVTCVTGKPTALGANNVVVSQGESSSTLEDGYAYRAFLYAAASADDNIRQYEIFTTGELSPLTPATVAAGDGPNFVHWAPGSAIFYALNAEAGSISVYSFVGTGGNLVELSGSPSTASAFNFATIFDGFLLYQATGSLVGADVQLFGFNEDGSLSDTGGFGTASQTRGVALTADESSLYVTTGNGTSSLIGYQIQNNGNLVEQSASPYFTSTSPGEVAIAGDGKFVFLDDRDMDRIDIQIRNTSTGVLTDGGDFDSGIVNDIGLTAHPSKRCLYALAKNGSGGTMMFWNPDTGALFNHPSMDFGSEMGPQALVIDPSETYAFVSSSAGKINRYSIGPDGHLASLGATVDAGNAPIGLAVR